MGPQQLAGVLSIVARGAAGGRGQAVRRGRPTPPMRADGRGADRARVAADVPVRAGLRRRRSSTPATPAPCSAWPVRDPQRPGRRAHAASASSGCEPMTDRVAVLVANRGEIARRIFRTCRAWASRPSPSTPTPTPTPRTCGEADDAVRLPGARPAETYLRAELIIAAARARGRRRRPSRLRLPVRERRVRPGGADAGLTWIGPPPEAIEAMGSKVASKRLMARRRRARSSTRPRPGRRSPRPTCPVLIKASAGGGGRGMRVVRSARPTCRGGSRPRARGRQPRSAIRPSSASATWTAGATSRSRSSADAHGTRLGLGERECSIQRRHQKVVEEAPSPLVDDGMRERLCDGRGRGRAAAVGYVGAGTVEFLADARRRLLLPRDEHPPAGRAPGHRVRHRARPRRACSSDRRGRAAAAAPPPPLTGHAIEARLYAEDPAAGWLPAERHAAPFDVPGVTPTFACRRRRPAARLRRRDGTSSAPLRPDARQGDRLRADPRRGGAAGSPPRCAGARIHGLVTNRDLLVRVLRHPAFLAGDTDTAFFDRHGLDDAGRAAGRRRGRAALGAGGRARRRRGEPGRGAGAGRRAQRLAQRRVRSRTGATSRGRPSRSRYRLTPRRRAASPTDHDDVRLLGRQPGTRSCSRRPGCGGCSPSPATVGPRARRLRARAGRRCAPVAALPRHRVRRRPPGR